MDGTLYVIITLAIGILYCDNLFDDLEMTCTDDHNMTLNRLTPAMVVCHKKTKAKKTLSKCIMSKIDELK